VANTIQDKMAGQNAPIEEPSQHLSLEAAQTIASHNARAATSGKRQLVLALSGLMLMGVAAWGVHLRDPHTDTASQPSHPSQELAFTPGFKPGLRTQGFLTAPATQGLPAPVAMLPGQTGQALFPPARGGYRQAMASVRMNAAGGDTAAADEPSSMETLATTALDSAGDPAKLEDSIKNMVADDKKMLTGLQAAVLAKAKSMPGISEPLGPDAPNGFWDPSGFCTEVADNWGGPGVPSEGKLCFYQEVEIKHGRVAMLAALGFLVGENFHPLFGGDIDVPSYLAFQQTPLQTFWPAVVAAIAIPELYSVFTFNEPFEKTNPPFRTRSKLWTVKTDHAAGDMGFDPLGLKPKEPEKLKEMQTKEINNGRLAMLAAAGMVAQELVTGEKILATDGVLASAWTAGGR